MISVSNVARRMREAIIAALTATTNDVLIVSHQFPIAMARVAFERRIDEPNATLFASQMPWLFVRGRSAVASITTLTLDGSVLAQVGYWAGVER